MPTAPPPWRRTPWSAGVLAGLRRTFRPSGSLVPTVPPCRPTVGREAHGPCPPTAVAGEDAGAPGERRQAHTRQHALPLQAQRSVRLDHPHPLRRVQRFNPRRKSRSTVSPPILASRARIFGSCFLASFRLPPLANISGTASSRPAPGETMSGYQQGVSSRSLRRPPSFAGATSGISADPKRKTVHENGARSPVQEYRDHFRPSCRSSQMNRGRRRSGRGTTQRETGSAAWADRERPTTCQCAVTSCRSILGSSDFSVPRFADA